MLSQREKIVQISGWNRKKYSFPNNWPRTYKVGIDLDQEKILKSHFWAPLSIGLKDIYRWTKS